jgi:hypothetical protein
MRTDEDRNAKGIRNSFMPTFMSICVLKCEENFSWRRKKSLGIVSSFGFSITTATWHAQSKQQQIFIPLYWWQNPLEFLECSQESTTTFETVSYFNLWNEIRSNLFNLRKISNFLKHRRVNYPSLPLVQIKIEISASLALCTSFVCSFDSFGVDCHSNAMLNWKLIQIQVDTYCFFASSISSSLPIWHVHNQAYQLEFIMPNHNQFNLFHRCNRKPQRLSNKTCIL